MTETSDESLIIEMNSLPIAGVMIRTACGRMIRRMQVVRPGMPSAWAASVWPRGTAWMPARKISVM